MSTLISPNELRSMMENDTDLLVIDVREPSEFQSGTIEGAINIPSGSIMYEIGSHVRGFSDPIVLFCRSGARSAAAAKVLEYKGYSNIYDLSGGYLNW